MARRRAAAQRSPRSKGAASAGATRPGRKPAAARRAPGKAPSRDCKPARASSATSKATTRSPLSHGSRAAANQKPAAATPSRPPAVPRAPAVPPPAHPPTAAADGLAWIPAESGYSLALEAGRLVCRNPAGKRLASVPKPVRDGEAAARLDELRDWLSEHERACAETAAAWMLRSLPVPRAVLEAIWPDPAWRRCLENAVVTPQSPGSSHVATAHASASASAASAAVTAGFLRGVHPERGLGLVDLDGETHWLPAAGVAIPHPVLLPDLADFRALAAELDLRQGLPQLFREIFPRPSDLAADHTTLGEYSGGRFAQLMHAVGKTRALGYRVRGGFAVSQVWEAGRPVEARFWIGADSPEMETATGDLLWVDERERVLRLREVGPVAWSEGVRMAGAIYAARVVEGGKDGSP
ncbi:MAG: DUF4132 domain-containing protein [Planctomycetes bacterium]|nr:DUF4132 domain-containing protein [Planctomycetota bacterium]